MLGCLDSDFTFTNPITSLEGSVRHFYYGLFCKYCGYLQWYSMLCKSKATRTFIPVKILHAFYGRITRNINLISMLCLLCC